VPNLSGLFEDNKGCPFGEGNIKKGVPPTLPPVPTEETEKGPAVPPLLIASVERAADLARRELTDRGRITPKALFVYDAPRTTVVSLSWRDEFGRDTLLRRIRDKALKEAALAVVIVGIPPTEEGHLLMLSGITPESEATVSIDYALDTATGTVGRWELRWLNVAPGTASRVELDWH